MKKLFFVICMMLMSVGAFAQQGKMTIGAHGALGLNGNKNFGIGANVGYEVIDNVRGVAEFDYFFKKDYVSQWLVQVNAEYLFRVADGKFAIYPIAGINLFGFKWDADLMGASSSDSKLGMTIGGGVEYQLLENLGLKVEYNYLTQYDGASLLKFGIVIPF
jgi:opacity protein-like surface antigen